MSSSSSTPGKLSAQVRAEAIAAARGGLWERLLAFLRLDGGRARRRAAQARSWGAGAVGEQRTAQLVAPLLAEGWQVLHDRAIPGSRANLDHLLITPCGTRVVVVDSKLWSAKRGPVMLLRSGTLMHGGYSRDRDVESLRFEAERVARVLRVPVSAAMCVHNAQVSAGAFGIRDVMVLEAPLLLPYLRSLATGRPYPLAVQLLAERAGREFPPYVEGGAR